MCAQTATVARSLVITIILLLASQIPDAHSVSQKRVRAAGEKEAGKPMVGSDMSQAAFGEFAFVRSMELPPGREETVQLALNEIIPQLVENDERLARILGFKSAIEARNLVSGKPLPVFTIGLTTLRSYEPGMHVAILLLRDQQSLRFIYPVCIDHEAAVTCSRALLRTGLMLEFGAGTKKWRVDSVGSKIMVLRIAEFAGRGASFVMLVPPLNKFYLGRTTSDGKGLEFTVMFEDGDLNLGVGAEVDGETLFKALKQLALDHDVVRPH